MTGRYRGYDLTIDSEFEIPGAAPTALDAHQADIIISPGVAEIGPVDRTNGPYSRSGDALLFDVPGVARYLAKTPRDLVIAPYAGSDPEHVSALLVATALPMMLWMRGGLVLHAAGLIMPGASSAIALAGPSGIGKSSLADRFLADGARLVGDDSLLLSIADNRTVAAGLPASYLLPGSPGEPRRAYHVPPDFQVARAPLGAIIVLVRADQSKVQASSRVSGLAALEVLLQNRHRPRVPAIMGRDGTLLASSTQHCRNVPIYRLEIVENDLGAAQAGLNAILDGLDDGD